MILPLLLTLAALLCGAAAWPCLSMATRYARWSSAHYKVFRQSLFAWLLAAALCVILCLACLLWALWLVI